MFQKLSAKKLVEQCNLEKAKRNTWKVPNLNTSQNGLNESFRFLTNFPLFFKFIVDIIFYI